MHAATNSMTQTADQVALAPNAPNMAANQQLEQQMAALQQQFNQLHATVANNHTEVMQAINQLNQTINQLDQAWVIITFF